MIISRRTAWFLIGFAMWNLYVWVTFVSNVYPQHHLDRFFLIHAAIGSITSVAGLVVGLVGVKALRAIRSRQA